MNSIGEEYLRAVSAWLWEASWQSTLLAAVVLVVQWVLKRQLSARWRSALWLLVLARLILPALPPTRFSAYNWLPNRRHAAPPANASAPAHPSQEVTATFRSAPVLAPFNGMPLTFPSEALPHEPLMPRTPMTPALTASRTASNPLPVLPLVWMAGCVAISGYTIAVYLRLGRKVNRLRAETPEGLTKQFMDAKAELKVSHADLVVSEAVSTPFVTGFWKARVVLPMGLDTKLSSEDIRMVLLHELAHVKRGDLWMTWLSWLAATLHWFNPCIRYALALARKDREMACDEWVLRLVEDARAYGAALIRFMELNQPPTPAPGFGAIGIFEGKSALLQRIRRIATYRRPTLLASLSGFAVLIVVGLFTLTNASDPPSPSADLSRPKPRPTTRDLEADFAELQKALRNVGEVDHHATQVLMGNYMYSLYVRGKPFEEGSVSLVPPDYNFVIHDFGAEAAIRAKTEFKHFSPFLYDAIERGDAEVLRELLKDGAVPNRPDNDESHLFAPDGDPVIERPAPKVGPVREIRVQEDKRPLFEPLEAAVNSLTQAPNDDRRRQIVQLLLSYGANPNPKLANHSSILYMPVANDMVELVKFLLDAGIDPRKDADGGRALSEQVERYGSNEMKNLIRAALERKAEVALASGADRLGAGQKTVVMDADDAARLAASLANSKAQGQVGAAPFKPSQDTPIFSEGRWLWQATVGYGKGDLQAVVSFTKTGADAQVRVQTLIFEPPMTR